MAFSFDVSLKNTKTALSSEAHQVSAQRVNSSRQQDLDAAVSSKFIEVITSPITNVVNDAVDEVSGAVDTIASVADTLHEAGMQLGTAVANAAAVVGNHVVKPAITKAASLPSSVRNLANELGEVRFRV